MFSTVELTRMEKSVGSEENFRVSNDQWGLNDRDQLFS